MKKDYFMKLWNEPREDGYWTKMRLLREKGCNRCHNTQVLVQWTGSEYLCEQCWNKEE